MELRQIIFSALLFILTYFFAVLPLNAESVFLKDGSIIDGTIVSDSTSSVSVRTEDRKIKSIPRGNVLRILYTKLKMGKIYIQKRDGEGIVAFMVDEDQETYTFRKELYNPKEFTLNRNDVLFMAEKNPSGLKADGEIKTDRVSLTWLPPYDAVRKYKIYTKKEKDGRYEPADSTKSKSITLKGLTSNTTYFIIVTSVDTDDYESSPSNELKITTKNIAPGEPVILSVEIPGNDDRRISWSEAADPDGKVIKYRVHGTVDGKRSMIAEVKTTGYLLKKASGYDKVEIAAVDDRDAESGAVKVKLTEDKNRVSFRPSLFIPLSKFGEMAGIGYGGMINYTRTGFIFSGVEAGFGAGFHYLPGEDLSEKKQMEYSPFLVAPILINLGYRIQLGDSFAVIPSVSGGGAYIQIDYTKKGTNSSDDKKVSDYSIDPAVKGGITLELLVCESVSISLYGEYGTFFEESGTMPFAAAGLGIDYRF